MDFINCDCECDCALIWNSAESCNASGETVLVNPTSHWPHFCGLPPLYSTRCNGLGGRTGSHIRRRRASNREKNLAKRKQRHRGRAYRLERRREFRLTWNRSFHLVSPRRAWSVRRKLSEITRVRAPAAGRNSHLAHSVTRLSVELARRIFQRTGLNTNARTSPISFANDRSSGAIHGCAFATIARQDAR